MMVLVSVPPVSIQLSGGYLNWKPKVEFVKVSQLLVTEVAVGVAGTSEVDVGKGVLSWVGICVAVGVGVSPGKSGVEDGTGDPTGVGVGVEVFPRTTRLAPTNGSS